MTQRRGRPRRCGARGRGPGTGTAQASVVFRQRLDMPLVDALKTGLFEKIPGVGKAIYEKAQSLVETESFPLLDRLKQQIPAGVQEILSLPGVTGRALLALMQKFPIQNAEQLRALLKSGQVQAERFTPAISAVIRRLKEWK